jgi:hypothetical protein
MIMNILPDPFGPTIRVTGAKKLINCGSLGPKERIPFDLIYKFNIFCFRNIK